MANSTIQPYPLYDTTYTIHRVSPLYTRLDFPLDNAALLHHSRVFRDILAGDTLRGVRVSLGSASDAAHVGSLQSVTWRMLPGEDVWESEDVTGADITMGSIMGKGIVVEVDYEKIKYRAVMLRGEKKNHEKTQKGFEHFPLLLMRMPGTLRDTLTTFIATTFDARVAPVNLSGLILRDSFESYISDCCVIDDGEAMDMVESNRSIRKIVGDVKITFGFPSAQTDDLQTVEITVDREDVPRMVQKGKKSEVKDSPFMKALAKYTQVHLGMKIDQNDKVSVFRIACGPFVLGHEGRIKLNAPSEDNAVQRRATWNLANRLVERLGEREASLVDLG